MPNLYNLRALSATHFQMAKFDSDLNVEAVYDLEIKGTGYSCNCPASARVIKYKPCKHQRMMRFMLGAVNTQRFYEPESGSWCEPIIGPEAEIEQDMSPVPVSIMKEPVNATTPAPPSIPEAITAAMSGVAVRVASEIPERPIVARRV